MTSAPLPPGGPIAPGGPRLQGPSAPPDGQHPPGPGSEIGTGPVWAPAGPPANGGTTTAVPPAGDDDHALQQALDAALDQLDRADAERNPPTAAELAEERAAAAGDPNARAAVSRRHRRAGLRTALSSMSTRLTSERTARAVEAAATAAEASQRAAEQLVADERRDQRPASHPFKTGFLAGLGLILAYVTYLAVDTVRSTLIVIAVAALIAIGLDPAVGWLMRRKIRRGWAVTMIFLVMLAAIGGAIYAIVPPIVTETAGFIKSVPSLITNLLSNPTLKALNDKTQILTQLQSSDFIQKLGTGAAGSILAAGVTVAGIAADLLIVIILTLFFLAGFPAIKQAGYRLAPASRRMRVSDLGDKILKQMGGYLSGAGLVAVQAGLVAGAFAAIVHLPYPWAIGLGAALLDLLPVIGPIIVGVSMTLLGFTHSLTIGIIAGAFYVCQHMFETYWLYPRVMRRQVDISTGAVVVAILIGAALLGVTGALLAVPVAAAVQLIVREVVMPMQERK